MVVAVSVVAVVEGVVGVASVDVVAGVVDVVTASILIFKESTQLLF